MSRSCAGPLGTGRPALAPLWFTAVPLTSPQILSPSASASLSRFSTITPHPSLRTKPSADESKALHAPVFDSIPSSLWNRTRERDSVAFTPPARARFTSPRLKAAAAWWTAAKEDAQATSTGIAGPSKPKTKATRPAPMLLEVPK